MKPLLIIKAGTKLPSLMDVRGDYAEWIAAAAGVAASGFRVAAVCDGESLPPCAAVGAAVITGSAAMLTDKASWMMATESWLRMAVAERLPLLGICFGHQLLAEAFGGEVDYNPLGVEVGTVELQLGGAAAVDPLFSRLPVRMAVQATHRQTVVRLPPGATLLAGSALDRHQAFRLGDGAWGVQFHPEFDPYIVCRFIDHFRPRLQAEGKDAAALVAAVRPTPESRTVIRDFVMLAGLR